MAKDTEMAQANQEAGKPINEMDSGARQETINARTQQTLFLKSAERKRRRRLDLKTLNGTLRESARVYRDLIGGKITLAEAEMRSRHLSRHATTLTAKVEQEQIAALADLYRSRRGEPSAQLLIDDAQAKEPAK